MPKNETDEKRMAKLSTLTTTELSQKKAQLERELALIKKAEAAKKRSAETRRKILIGSYYLEQMKRDPAAEKQLMVALDSYLTRDDDRLLFGLPVKTSDTPPNTQLPGVSVSPGDQLAAAQRLTPNSADHGAPGRVFGHAQDAPKNGQEGHEDRKEEVEPVEKKKGWFSS